jgi:serine/threonine protein kinase
VGSLTEIARVRVLIFISKHSEAALTTLKSIHRIGILHGDIRPENILVSDSGITIIDFGHSCRCNNQVAKNKEYQRLRSLLVLASECDLEGSSSRNE